MGDPSGVGLSTESSGASFVSGCSGRFFKARSKSREVIEERNLSNAAETVPSACRKRSSSPRCFSRRITSSLISWARLRGTLEIDGNIHPDGVCVRKQIAYSEFRVACRFDLGHCGLGASNSFREIFLRQSRLYTKCRQHSRNRTVCELVPDRVEFLLFEAETFGEFNRMRYFFSHVQPLCPAFRPERPGRKGSRHPDAFALRRMTLALK